MKVSGNTSWTGGTTVANSATAALSITTSGGSTGGGGGSTSTLTITTTSLPGATVGTTYSQELTATGGTGTGYAWTVTSGSLPSWAALNASTGVISGSPAAGTSNFTVKVTDSANNTATQALSITASGAAQPDGPTGTWTLAWNDEFNNAAGMSGSTNGLSRSKWNVGNYYGPSAPGGAGYTGTSKTASNGAGAIEFYGPGALTFPSGGGMEMSCFASGDGPDGSYSISGFSSTSESGGVNTAGIMNITPNTGYSVPSAIASTVIQAASIVIEVQCQWAGPNEAAGAGDTGNYWQWIGHYDSGDCSTPDYPDSGEWTQEIDIWESFGGGTLGDDFFLTFHEASSYGSIVSTPSSDASTDLSLAMHKYTVEYTYSTVKLWIDGVAVTGISPTTAECEAQWATPQYLGIMFQLTEDYVATGATSGGQTATPLKVSYVRVFTQS